MATQLKETIYDPNLITVIKPNHIWLPINFERTMEIRYTLAIDQNPYKGTFENPDWDFIALQILLASRRYKKWIGKEGFNYQHQNREVVDGMIQAGWLRTIDLAGFTLTEIAIEKLLLKSLEIRTSNNS
ncbi:MAG: hypothetical protein AAB784_02710 [Patescibacteria group bacterium]